MGMTRRWQGCFGRLWHLLLISNLVLSKMVLVFGARRLCYLLPVVLLFVNKLAFEFWFWGPFDRKLETLIRRV
jgi:hypothetical protein